MPFLFDEAEYQHAYLCENIEKFNDNQTCKRYRANHIETLTG